jgi:hypothetical protein
MCRFICSYVVYLFSTIFSKGVKSENVELGKYTKRICYLIKYD